MNGRGKQSASNNSIRVAHRDLIREVGFAQIEHVVTLDADLSDGAYRTLAILHFYWQQKSSCFPSVETLAKDRGVNRQTITRHLKELARAKFKLITRSRRFNDSSMTYLEPLSKRYREIAKKILAARADRKAERDAEMNVSKNEHSNNGSSAHVSKMVRHTYQKSNVTRIKNGTQRITTEEYSSSSSNPNAAFAKAFTALDTLMEGLSPSETDDFRDMWSQYPDPEAHQYAFEQMRDHADGFNLRFYFTTLKRRSARNKTPRKARAQSPETKPVEKREIADPEKVKAAIRARRATALKEASDGK